MLAGWISNFYKYAPDDEIEATEAQQEVVEHHREKARKFLVTRDELGLDSVAEEEQGDGSDSNAASAAGKEPSEIGRIVIERRKEDEEFEDDDDDEDEDDDYEGTHKDNILKPATKIDMIDPHERKEEEWKSQTRSYHAAVDAALFPFDFCSDEDDDQGGKGGKGDDDDDDNDDDDDSGAGGAAKKSGSNVTSKAASISMALQPLAATTLPPLMRSLTHLFPGNKAAREEARLQQQPAGSMAKLPSSLSPPCPPRRFLEDSIGEDGSGISGGFILRAQYTPAQSLRLRDTRDRESQILKKADKRDARPRYCTRRIRISKR